MGFNRLLLKIAIEIVNFPMKKVVFHSYVSLPEGNTKKKHLQITSNSHCISMQILR
jgi:hypothetical protein